MISGRLVPCTALLALLYLPLEVVAQERSTSFDADKAGMVGIVGFGGEIYRIEDQVGGGARKDGSPYESSTIALKDGRLLMVFSGRQTPEGNHSLPMKHQTISTDGGKTWSMPVPLVLKDGGKVTGGRPVTLMRLKSGALGCLCRRVFYRSDDEGETWGSSPALLLDADKAKTMSAFGWDEWSLVELKDGRLLAMVRTTLGQLFQTISPDQGETWTAARPSSLASDQAACLLRRIPKTGHLLLIWTQCSVEERERYLTRHRLSCAISRDEGQTWDKFKNLESLDDISRIAAPKEVRVVRANPDKFPEAVKGYHQPLDRKRYHRAPGALRCAYPTCAFFGDKAVVTYGYGCNQDPIGYVACKIRVLPQTWFSE